MASIVKPVVMKLKLGNSRVAQSFVSANDRQHIYFVQQSNTLNAERRGDLTITKMNYHSWAVVGKMWLKGCGHGVAIGCDSDGMVWVEAGPISHIKGSARGNTLFRFKFENKKTIRNPKGLILPGLTRVTPQVNGNIVAVRGWTGRKYVCNMYSLSNLMMGSIVKISSTDINSPKLFQGWCSDGISIYTLSGKNKETAVIKNMKTGKVFDTKVKLKGYSEPEGICFIDGILWFGIASGVVGARRYNLFKVEGF